MVWSGSFGFEETGSGNRNWFTFGLAIGLNVFILPLLGIHLRFLGILPLERLSGVAPPCSTQRRGGGSGGGASEFLVEEANFTISLESLYKQAIG